MNYFVPILRLLGDVDVAWTSTCLDSNLFGAFLMIGVVVVSDQK
jgi:hypothetical protein